MILQKVSGPRVMVDQMRDYKLGLLFTIVATALMLYVFQQRFDNADSLLNGLTYDTLMYVSLIEGGEAPEPFSTRFLLVFLGQILPGTALENILTLNIVCLFVLTVALFHLSSLYSVNQNSAFLSVLFIFGTFSFSYNFTNPYLTDLPALAFLTLFIISVHNKHYYKSCFFMVITLFFRETAIVLLPLFLTSFRFKLAAIGISTGVIAYIAPKLYIAGSIYSPEFQENLHLAYVIKVLLSLGWVWVLVCFSVITNVYRLKQFEIALLFFSFSGALFSSLTAADTTRMFFLMTPICTILIAMLLNDITKRLCLWAGLSVLVIMQTMLMLPNIFHKQTSFSSIEDLAISNVVEISIINIVIFLLILTNRRYFLESILNRSQRN